MADPLSATASIIAILQLSAKILQYLRAVSGASNDRNKLILEISSLRGILQTLQDTLKDASMTTWAPTLHSLADSDGPLALVEAALKEIARKVGKHSRTSSGIKSLASSVSWPFKEREVEKLLGVIERQKSLLLLAFDNDHVALSKSIHSNTKVIIDRISGVEDVIQQQHIQNEDARIREEGKKSGTKRCYLHPISSITFGVVYGMLC